MKSLVFAMLHFPHFFFAPNIDKKRCMCLDFSYISVNMERDLKLKVHAVAYFGNILGHHRLFSNMDLHHITNTEKLSNYVFKKNQTYNILNAPHFFISANIGAIIGGTIGGLLLLLLLLLLIICCIR